jgi:hypothetical protein
MMLDTLQAQHKLTYEEAAAGDAALKRRSATESVRVRWS